MPAVTPVPITPMAWRRDVIPAGELAFSAVSSSGKFIVVPVDLPSDSSATPRAPGLPAGPIEAEGLAAGKSDGPPSLKHGNCCHPAGILGLDSGPGSPLRPLGRTLAFGQTLL